MKHAFIRDEPGTGSYHWRVPVDLRETDPPRNSSRTGYGSRIPTQYQVFHARRWKRVYAICYSDCSTLYVRDGKGRAIIDIVDDGKVHS